MSTTRLIEMSDDDLERLLAVARGADSVELKLTVPDEHHRSTAVALGMTRWTHRCARCTSSTRRTWRSTATGSSCRPGACWAAATTRS
jgi:hypothetical protein